MRESYALNAVALQAVANLSPRRGSPNRLAPERYRKPLAHKRGAGQPLPVQRRRVCDHEGACRTDLRRVLGGRFSSAVTTI